LYLQAPFVKPVERLGIGLGLHLEREPARSYYMRRGLHAGSFHRSSPGAEPYDSIRALADLDWPVADRRVQVVKTFRIEQRRRVTISEKDGQRTKGKTPVAQPSTNYHATNFELGSISTLFIPQFSRSRWRIDTEVFHTLVFHTLTIDCHLKHPAVHQTTDLVLLTMIRFLAYNLSLVFYHRQVCSHARRKCDTFHELAKRFAYWFLALSPNTS
jgi:hypothetical protein